MDFISPKVNGYLHPTWKLKFEHDSIWDTELSRVKISPFTTYTLCYSLFIGILGRDYAYNLEDN